MKYISYYDIFGVSKNATLNEIKDAYRKKAREFHPDVVGSSKESNKRMALFNKAYQTLSDPDERRAYDMRLYNATGARRSEKRTYNRPYTGETNTDSTAYKPSDRPQKNKSRFNWSWLVFFALIVFGLFTNSRTKVSNSSVSNNRPVYQISSTPSPISTSHSPKIYFGATSVPIQTPTPITPTIDCIGPDGKHLQITQQACDDFNNAWKKSTPTVQVQNNQQNYGDHCNSCPDNSYCSYGSCLCKDGYTKNYNNGRCEKCPDNSTGQYGSCTCNTGYARNYNTGQCDKLNCPSNSHESGNNCVCNDNYVMNYGTGQCDKCPNNSTYSYGSCNCNSGFAKNYSNGQCEQLNCPSNSHISDNSCVCNDNYVKDYSTGQCNPCPTNSTWSYGYCSCNSGYVKNYSTGQCDKQ